MFQNKAYTKNNHSNVTHFFLIFQCSPYQAVTGKIYRLKQQRVTVLTAYNLLKVS